MFGAVIGLVVLVSSQTGDALQCLNCPAVADPRLCKHTTTCFAGEKCGLETFISTDGDLEYKLGCVEEHTCHLPKTAVGPHVRNTYFSCHQCCDDYDLCNIRGCNSTGLPLDRGPLCYNCDSSTKGAQCHVITHCEAHEVCFNDATLEFQNYMLYTSGCRSKHSCADVSINPLSGFGRRTTSICTECCQGDLCNTHCEATAGCQDDVTCSRLMAQFDVCKSPDLAQQFCRRTCSLCSGTSACKDTRLDCSYIRTLVNVCASQQTAKSYGCEGYCGFCTGASGHVTPTTTGPSIAATQLTTLPTTRPTTRPTTLSTKPPTTRPTTRPTTLSTKPPSTRPTTLSTKPPTTPPTTLSTTTRMATTHPPTSTAMPPLSIGDRVVRGPDWRWQDQDGNSTGTVTGLPAPGWATVKWDNGVENTYRYGNGAKYDLEKVPFVLTTTMDPNYIFNVGDLVIRGPDWKWGIQDGHDQGEVTSVSTPLWVEVRWNNGVVNMYRNGYEGAHDIQLHPDCC